ncbi:MAG: hypothetical protein IT162_10865 [Bryobacterales bacterium]|nr:hypothetical protein [Bryobacterales bacterium]
MLKALTGVALAGVLAVGAVTTSPQKAEAHCYGCAVGAGVVGGLAAGAIIGSALAYPAYGYGYYGGPAYAYGPRCWWTRHRVAGPYGYGWRRVRVCR